MIAAINTTLYFAYGANTNLQSMGARCPAAVPLGAQVLQDHILVFRGVADVVPQDGATVHGAVWRITPECEAALDRFEGFPNLYIKHYGRLKVGGRWETVMWYAMRSRSLQQRPGGHYEACLREGYADFGLPAEQINAAIRRAARHQTKRNGQFLFDYR